MPRALGTIVATIWLLVCIVLAAVLPSHAASKPVVVDCARGQTIAAALVGTGPITILVKGTCQEDVTIARDDVTLQADPLGGALIGVSSAGNTITVDGARRVVIDRLNITGPRNGVVGINTAAFAVTNANIHDHLDGHGVAVFGGQAHIDGNVITGHTNGSGIVVDGGRATITGNTVSGNGRIINPAGSFVVGAGVTVNNAGSARIGITDAGVPRGNVISNNGPDGIFISTGSGVTLRSNTVSGNGRYGISVGRSHATMVGGNVIDSNGATGVFLLAGVLLQTPNSGSLPAIVDTITNNGFTGPAGFTRDGIDAFDDSVIDLRGAVVMNNNPNGVLVFGLSTARIRTHDAGAPTTISGNVGSGVATSFGATATVQRTASGAVLAGPVTLAGNGRYGICGNTAASPPSFVSVENGTDFGAGNTLGNISTTGC